MIQKYTVVITKEMSVDERNRKVLFSKFLHFGMYYSFSFSNDFLKLNHCKHNILIPNQKDGILVLILVIFSCYLQIICATIKSSLKSVCLLLRENICWQTISIGINNYSVQKTAYSWFLFDIKVVNLIYQSWTKNHTMQAIELRFQHFIQCIIVNGILKLHFYYYKAQFQFSAVQSSVLYGFILAITIIQFQSLSTRTLLLNYD